MLRSQMRRKACEHSWRSGRLAGAIELEAKCPPSFGTFVLIFAVLAFTRQTHASFRPRTRSVTSIIASRFGLGTIPTRSDGMRALAIHGRSKARIALEPRRSSVKTPTVRLLPLAFVFLLSTSLPAEPPQTVAEKSDYKATSRHADVMDFCQQLAKESKLVRLGELGTSNEGRKLPLVIVADPPVSNAEEAKKSGKLVVFALANIHAGEVDGKEALLMLARDIATAKRAGAGSPEPAPALITGVDLVFADVSKLAGDEI